MRPTLIPTSRLPATLATAALVCACAASPEWEEGTAEQGEDEAHAPSPDLPAETPPPAECADGNCDPTDLDTLTSRPRPTAVSATLDVEFAPPCTDGSDCAHEIPMTGRVGKLFGELDIVMRQFMKARCVGAGVLAVSRNGRRIYKRGFGRMQGRATANAMPGCVDAADPYNGLSRPVKPDSPMPVGSVTKFVTATVLRDLLAQQFGGDVTQMFLTDASKDLLPASLRNMLAGNTCVPVVFTDNGTCTRYCAGNGADTRWQNATVGDVIAHTLWLPDSAPDWVQQVASNIPAFRGYSASFHYSTEHNALATEFGADVATARAGLEAALQLGAGESIYFLNAYNALDGDDPVDEWLTAVAGRCLDWFPEGSFDSFTPTAKGPYSNTSYAFAERIVSHRHPSGRFLAPTGYPELHEGSAVDEFLEDMGIETGIETEEGIYHDQRVYPLPGYDPAGAVWPSQWPRDNPMGRVWDGTQNTYYSTREPENRPYCVWNGSTCDFTDFVAGVAGTRVRWDWQLQPQYQWAGSVALNSGTGALLVEAPVLLEIASKYYVARDDLRMGRLKSTCGSTCDAYAIKNGSRGGGHAYVSNVRAQSSGLCGGGSCLPDLDQNGRFIPSSAWDNPLNVQEPKVDYVVAVNQNNDNTGLDLYGSLDDFVRYGLSRLDWNRIDDAVENQRLQPVGVAMNSTGNTYYWYESDLRKVRSGTIAAHYNSDSATSSAAYELPSTRIGPDIIGVGINTSDNVYAWYDDGRVSKGTSLDLASLAEPAEFFLPQYRSVRDVVGIDIASTGTAYAWYTNGTRSWGTVYDLSMGTGSYSTPLGQTPDDLLEMSIAAATNDHVWTLARDGSVYEGWSADLDSYCPNNCKRPLVAEIGMDIEGNTWIWYKTGYYRRLDGTLYDNLAGYDVIERGYYHMPSNQTGYTVVGADLAPVWMGETALGYYNSGGTFGVGDSLDSGDLPFTPTYPPGQSASTLVGLAVSADGSVYSWYANQTRAKGTYANLGSSFYGSSFSLPAGQPVQAIRGIAINWAVDDRVWVLYEDGSVSKGYTNNIGQLGYWPAQ